MLNKPSNITWHEFFTQSIDAKTSRPEVKAMLRTYVENVDFKIHKLTPANSPVDLLIPKPETSLREAVSTFSAANSKNRKLSGIWPLPLTDPLWKRFQQAAIEGFNKNPSLKDALKMHVKDALDASSLTSIQTMQGSVFNNPLDHYRYHSSDGLFIKNSLNDDRIPHRDKGSLAFIFCWSGRRTFLYSASQLKEVGILNRHIMGNIAMPTTETLDAYEFDKPCLMMIADNAYHGGWWVNPGRTHHEDRSVSVIFCKQETPELAAAKKQLHDSVVRMEQQIAQIKPIIDF